MSQEMGEENMYLFGLKVAEVEALDRKGYDAKQAYEEGPSELRQCIEQIADGHFSPDDPKRFTDLVDTLLVHGDRYKLFVDYEDYIRTQDRVSQDFQDKRAWARKTVLNIAAGGFFSSDRTIRDYAENIWGAEPCSVSMDAESVAADAV